MYNYGLLLPAGLWELSSGHQAFQETRQACEARRQGVGRQKTCRQGRARQGRRHEEGAPAQGQEAGNQAREIQGGGKGPRRSRQEGRRKGQAGSSEKSQGGQGRSQGRESRQA